MYKNNSNNELIKLLEIQEKLTFDAKLKLMEEIKTRKINVDISDLENSINNEFNKIEKLDYLKQLGFEADFDGNLIKIERTTKALIGDILALVLGILFCCISIIALTKIIGSAKNETISVFSFIINLIQVSLGLIGIKFLKSIKRIFDYTGFELIKNNDIITIKKREDLKIIEASKSKNLLNIKETDESLFLELENTLILSCNKENIIQKKTFEKLFNVLRE